jgi:hypothetical protein
VDRFLVCGKLPLSSCLVFTFSALVLFPSMCSLHMLCELPSPWCLITT